MYMGFIQVTQSPYNIFLLNLLYLTASLKSSSKFNFQNIRNPSLLSLFQHAVLYLIILISVRFLVSRKLFLSTYLSIHHLSISLEFNLTFSKIAIPMISEKTFLSAFFSHSYFSKVNSQTHFCSFRKSSSLLAFEISKNFFFYFLCLF